MTVLTITQLLFRLFYYLSSLHETADYKQLLDEVFVISGIIKVEVSVIGWGW